MREGEGGGRRGAGLEERKGKRQGCEAVWEGGSEIQGIGIENNLEAFDDKHQVFIVRLCVKTLNRAPTVSIEEESCAMLLDGGKDAVEGEGEDKIEGNFDAVDAVRHEGGGE